MTATTATITAAKVREATRVSVEFKIISANLRTAFPHSLPFSNDMSINMELATRHEDVLALLSDVVYAECG